ncbi:MAG: Abi family protein [Clostridia bacterium]|nr:Abi family protein [Clostridia bacterium]
MSKPKSIDMLMKYMREKHKIKINGSTHKRKLRNIGYYHGYKGYRRIKGSEHFLAYTSFDEILAVNSFDMKLKTMLYPQIMFIETALKNYVLEVILEKSKSEKFSDIYENLMTDFKEHKEKYNEGINNRLKVRNAVYAALSKGYNERKMVIEHFYNRDRNVPIWAIFEILTLGDFKNFVLCLNRECRMAISKSLNLYKPCDKNGTLIEEIISALKDLRNSVAHNNVVFDARFQSGEGVDEALKECLRAEMNLKTQVDFEKIDDYIILIVYMLTRFTVPKTEINHFIKAFECAVEDLKKHIPANLFNQIVNPDTADKIENMKQFARNARVDVS